jgi:hypothetical protein
LANRIPGSRCSVRGVSLTTIPGVGVMAGPVAMT